jgi:hypothetical protein
MRSKDKTKLLLINEVEMLQKQIAELEKAMMEKTLIEQELSIAYDALNSTVGAIIISDFNGKINFVNFSFLRMCRRLYSNSFGSRVYAQSLPGMREKIVS